MQANYNNKNRQEAMQRKDMNQELLEYVYLKQIFDIQAKIKETKEKIEIDGICASFDKHLMNIFDMMITEFILLSQRVVSAEKALTLLEQKIADCGNILHTTGAIQQTTADIIHELVSENAKIKEDLHQLMSHIPKGENL